MSVIPLSQKEAIESLDAAEGTRPYGSGVQEAQPDSSEKFDKHLRAAIEKNYREDDPAPDKRDLDTIISEIIVQS